VLKDCLVTSASKLKFKLSVGQRQASLKCRHRFTWRIWPTIPALYNAQKSNKKENIWKKRKVHSAGKRN